ncbi:hypothetical protein [Bordetella genomosp. 13]|uniref:hypothetical protein n=1 Tax=Bordetella genomosp. 13 TaxID=463040 RepID=UPI0011A26217|nr:hypothetical protein [Bordetella genomosp. 13]
MNQNNLIYKGYRLTAKVVRGPLAAQADVPSGPIFTATVMVVPASAVQDPGHEYPVPCFDSGGFVYSPREAVHAAVCHGQHIVDGLMGVQS